MTLTEVNAIINAPDASQWSGHRDRVLRAALYNTGARVSEIVGIKDEDVSLESRQLVLHGKGRKEHVVPLWNKTISQIRLWIKKSGVVNGQPLSPNIKGGHMTRSGVEKRFAEAVADAQKICRTLESRSIGPHTFRHTTAMHLLEASVDISVIALWLGHESIETTNIYIASSMEIKEKALAVLQPPEVTTRRFRPKDQRLAYLEGL